VGNPWPPPPGGGGGNPWPPPPGGGAEILALLLQVETLETLALLQVETNFENVDRIDMDTYALPLYNACYVTICIIMKIGECLLLPSID
jgi:hypothetical protein